MFVIQINGLRQALGNPGKTKKNNVIVNRGWLADARCNHTQSALERDDVAFDGQADISARLERLPVTKRVFWTRNIIGAATFFDGYTTIAIAYAMPVLVREWALSPEQTGLITVARLSRSARRSRILRLARGADRPPQRLAVHHPRVRQHGCGLPVRLGRSFHDDLPIHSRYRHRRRGPTSRALISIEYIWLQVARAGSFCCTKSRSCWASSAPVSSVALCADLRLSRPCLSSGLVPAVVTYSRFVFS